MQADPIVSVRPVVSELVGRPFRVFGTFGMLLVTRSEVIDVAYEVMTTRLRAIDLACSRFRPDSELSAVNRAGGLQVRVSPLFTQALAVALRAAEITDGDLDPTCGASLAGLGYDRDFAQVRRGPADAPIRPVPAGGWQSVRLDAARGTVQVPEGVQLDLGATAKALAADLTASAAATATGAGVLVNLGGDIAVAGPAPAAGWRVEIAADSPAVAGRVRGPMVMIFDGGLATSGTGARSWRAGGQRLHHILSPGTGMPAVSRWMSATVAAASCVDANTASTAAIIRSHHAPGWLAGLGLPARLVGTDGTVITTGAWPS